MGWRRCCPQSAGAAATRQSRVPGQLCQDIPGGFGPESSPSVQALRVGRTPEQAQGEAACSLPPANIGHNVPYGLLAGCWKHRLPARHGICMAAVSGVLQSAAVYHVASCGANAQSAAAAHGVCASPCDIVQQHPRMPKCLTSLSAAACMFLRLLPYPAGAPAHLHSLCPGHHPAA